MPAPKLEECAHILIVEGYSDLLFFAEALEWLKKPSGVFIKDLGGSGNFKLDRPGPRAITGQPVTTGGWTVGPPRIGLFVVPGGGRQGEIETLVWEAWANDPANVGPRACVDSFLACMDRQGRAAHSPDKGRISALLSVLSDEDPRLGPGARDQVFAFARPELQPLLDFLRPLVTP